MKSVILSYPEKLALPLASKLSKINIFAIHLFLFIGILLPIGGPVASTFFAIIFYTIEKYRNNPYSNEFLKFSLQRIVIYFITTSFYSGYLINNYTSNEDIIISWRLLQLTLGVILFYDTIRAYKGKKGAFFYKNNKK